MSYLLYMYIWWPLIYLYCYWCCFFTVVNFMLAISCMLFLSIKHFKVTEFAEVLSVTLMAYVTYSPNYSFFETQFLV